MTEQEQQMTETNTQAQGVKLDLARLVRGLDWMPFGTGYTAYDPLFELQVLCVDRPEYDAERAARILSALDLDAIAALVGAHKSIIEQAEIADDPSHMTLALCREISRGVLARLGVTE
jgi:hypothetical protein